MFISTEVGIVYGNLECICIIPIGKHLCYPLYLPYILLFRYCAVVLLLFVCVNNDCIWIITWKSRDFSYNIVHESQVVIVII